MNWKLDQHLNTTPETAQELPLHSAQEKAFLGGELSAGQYFGLGRQDARSEAAFADQLALTEEKLAAPPSRTLRLFVRILFIAVVPLAYVVLGVVTVVQNSHRVIGWLSLVTAVVIVFVALLVDRRTAGHKRRTDL